MYTGINYGNEGIFFAFRAFTSTLKPERKRKEIRKREIPFSFNLHILFFVGWETVSPRGQVEVLSFLGLGFFWSTGVFEFSLRCFGTQWIRNKWKGPPVLATHCQRVPSSQMDALSNNVSPRCWNTWRALLSIAWNATEQTLRVFHGECFAFYIYNFLANICCDLFFKWLVAFIWWVSATSYQLSIVRLSAYFPDPQFFLFLIQQFTSSF